MNTRELMTGFNQALQEIDGCYAALARKYNLTFNALMFLYLLDGYKSLSQMEIGQWLFLPKSTIHSIYLDFSRKGFVEMIPGTGKEKKIRLTEEGKNFFAPILQETADLENDVVNTMGAEKMEQLLVSARQIASCMSAFMEDVHD